MAQQTAVMQIMSDIKEYVKSLDVPNNPVYQENQILIFSCFKKAMEICESRLAMEKEQIMDAHIEGQRVFDDYQHTQWTNDKSEQYYNETYGS